jgi:hypothetical protein
LGIFVSGKVAKKEHAQIVEVLEYVESLRPGLYLMEIKDSKGCDGKSKYEVTIEERRLEDLRRLNKLERRDEKAFEVVADVSTVGEKTYSLLGRPIVRSFVNEQTAQLGRTFHPLRLQHWAFSDLNPWMWPLSAFASAVKAARQIAPAENPYRRWEKAASEMIVAGLDLFRDVRDAMSEALFFQIYGPPAVMGAVEEAETGVEAATTDVRQLPLVQNALAAIGTGGYPEAIALMGALIGRRAGRVPLERLAIVDRFIRSDEVLAEHSPEEVRRIKAEQAVVAELEPERGLKSLPVLLADSKDRRRALKVLDKVVAEIEGTEEQRAIVDRIRGALASEPVARRRGKQEATERELAWTI